MKTKVLCLNHHHHLPLNITKSPWTNPRFTRSSTLIIPITTTRTPTYKTLKLNAESKGFGQTDDNLTRKKTKSNNNSNNNNSMFRDDMNYDDDDDKDEKIPDVVFERIIGRILLYVGAPMGTGLVLLQLFNVLKEKHLWDAPIWVPALTTLITFGASTLGVAYGALSTSWDPNNKGSILGIQEARQNWDDMWLADQEQQDTN
ncbi:uncharacterized protein PAM68-like [Impatiens glandulifera]|uniref:uncharacterized protein PAM68-like n=1 Tax=Impatiens glandulifera TaxID=253017 RepID=UPI001FB19D97|nr:uncharacterized protein PAM68-like [Impatiens glandulifera]